MNVTQNSQFFYGTAFKRLVMMIMTKKNNRNIHIMPAFHFEGSRNPKEFSEDAQSLLLTFSVSYLTFCVDRFNILRWSMRI